VNNLQKLPKRLHSLTDRQKQYLNDYDHRFTVLPSGRRSRKTLLSKRKILIHALRNPGSRLFHGAPTHRQAKAIFWAQLKEDTRSLWATRPSETELCVRLLGGSEIHVIGLDAPERIEGQPWDGCHITEMGNIKAHAWGENIRPVLSDTNGFAMLDGVPEGINFYYDLALYAAGGALPKTVPIDGAFAESPDDPDWCYYHWFSSDVLNQSEIEAAKRELDERTFKQEYEGSFESYEGLAYYAFGKHNLAPVQHEKERPVHIGMDFNVDPMTATFSHVMGDDVHQFGEAYLPNSNTWEMVDHIKRRFDINKCFIYPDSTGKARQANASRSNIAILQEAGFPVKARSANPYQIDRINAVNSLLKDRGPQTRYKVNPATCPKTINDFNKVEALEDGRLNKTQEATGLVHITDALGYKVTYLFPIKKPTLGSVKRW